ncbi:MAG: M4 family metallopeptidase, partial [Deltaproteobacteria bacterium]|nr:M4 family metallopeptidase [Deltaproteobacteria bacterium]
MIVVPIASAQIAAPTIQLGPTQQLQQGGSSVGGTIDSGLPGSPGHSFLGQFQHYLHPEIPAGVPAAKTGDCDISCLLEDVQDIDFGEDSIQSFRLKPDVRVPLHQFFTRYGAALGLRLGEGDSIKEARSFKDFLGYTHHRYKQYYNDLEVIAAEYNLVEKDGRVDYASTNGILGLNPPTAPFLTEPEALYLAEQAIGAASYPWKTDPTKYPVPPGTLAIGSKDFAMTKASARLVWRFDFSSHEVHIDAVTGETVNIEDNIIRFDYSEWGNLAKKESLPLNQNVPSKGTSYLYGEVNIMADLGLDGKYRLAHQQDGSVPAPLGTFDARPYHTQGGDPVIELFTDNDLEGMSPNNFLDPDDDVGISVHWGLERAMVFFASQFGWLGMDGKGEKAVKAFIIDDETKHKAWFQQGTNTVFFNVSPSKIAPTVLPPPVQLPTMGHEFTHGIFQEMTSGVYTGENCALNEGFAFYFGVVVLVFSDISPILDIDGDYFDYYVQDPKSGNKPTTYLGEFYQNSGGEDHCHVNATILTHWAYLLANGGTGTNDFGNEFNVVSIDPSATRGLVFLTMMNLSPTADFKEARQVSINVASFFLNPAAASSVMEAWHAVGVGDKTEAATIPVDGAKNVETWPAQLAYENQPKKTITKFQAASTYAFDSEPQVSLPSWSTTKDGKLMVGATFNLAQGEFFAPGKSYFWRVCFQKNKTDPSPLEKPAIKVGPPIVVAPDNSCDGDWSETHYFWGGKSVVLISPIKTPKQYHPPAVYPWDAVFQWVPVPNATAYDLYLGLEDEDDSGS